jgi:GMP synthase-like glutamine amidotransferase
MARILILQNDASVPPGYLETVCVKLGVEMHVVPLWEAPVPQPSGWDGVVSLGGHMGAYDEADFPFLKAEKQLLRTATESGIPTLGLCLGSQLLADALGGEAYLAERPEVDLLTVDLTPEGASDPVVSHLTGPVLVFHQDTWRPPPGAAVLASSGSYPQAFRWGSAIGIQPHPETTPDILDEWVTHDAARLLAQLAGTDPDRLAADFRASQDASAAGAIRFFTAWLAEVQAAAASVAPDAP